MGLKHAASGRDNVKGVSKAVCKARAIERTGVLFLDEPFIILKRYSGGPEEGGMNSTVDENKFRRVLEAYVGRLEVGFPEE